MLLIYYVTLAKTQYRALMSAVKTIKQRTYSGVLSSVVPTRLHHLCRTKRHLVVDVVVARS